MTAFSKGSISDYIEGEIFIPMYLCHAFLYPKLPEFLDFALPGISAHAATKKMDRS